MSGGAAPKGEQAWEGRLPRASSTEGESGESGEFIGSLTTQKLTTKVAGRRGCKASNRGGGRRVRRRVGGGRVGASGRGAHGQRRVQRHGPRRRAAWANAMGRRR